MTPRRTASLGLVLLASLAEPAAAAESWTGWSEFYRSFAVEPPPAATPTKIPGIHKVPDVTLKRGITGEPPKTKPKPKLGAAPPPTGAVPGWDPLPKKTVTGAAAQGSFSELQGIRTEITPLNDLPAAPRALQQKPPIGVPGAGYAGKDNVDTTRKLRAGDTTRSGDVLIHRWQKSSIGRR